jgi:hypothetical protein
MFDCKPEARRGLCRTLVMLNLLASLCTSAAAQVQGQPDPHHDAAESAFTQGGLHADEQCIKAVIDALDKGEQPPMPVWIAEMPRMFKKVLLRLGQLESIRFLREQKGERVYELWFAGGRLIWGISNPPPPEPVNMRIALLEHL